MVSNIFLWHYDVRIKWQTTDRCLTSPSFPLKCMQSLQNATTVNDGLPLTKADDINGALHLPWTDRQTAICFTHTRPLWRHPLPPSSHTTVPHGYLVIYIICIFPFWPCDGSVVTTTAMFDTWNNQAALFVCSKFFFSLSANDGRFDAGSRAAWWFCQCVVLFFFYDKIS